MKKVCVIGAKGFLGRTFHQYYLQKDSTILGTHYKPEQGYALVDLSRPVLPSLKEYTHALIVAASTDLAEIERNSHLSFRPNLEGTISLVEQLLEKEITPIVFSSDYVFNGRKGAYKEEDKGDPLNEYGKQKWQLEQILQQKYQTHVLVLRLGKVYGMGKGDRTLLDEMANAFSLKKVVKAAKDQIFSPIYIADVVSCVDKLIQKTAVGIYNLCGPTRVSRYQLACDIADQMQVDKSKHVIPILLDDLKENFQRPKQTDMRCEKINRELVHSFMPLASAIKKIAFSYA